jgi:PAS domain S-box-containing protein
MNNSAQEARALARVPGVGAPHALLHDAVRHLLDPGETGPDADLNFVLGQMSDAFFEGLALFTSEGRVAYANEALCRLLGRPRARVLGRPAREVFGARNARALLSAEDGAPTRHTLKLCVPGGGCAVVQVAVQRVARSCGDNVGCFAVMTDITARAEAEAALRRSESDLRLLSAQLLAAQELERQRVARELHDGIGQSLGGLKCSLEVCESLLHKGAVPESAQRLRELTERVRTMCEDVRRIAMDLRPSTLDDLGVLATVGWLTREFRGVYTHIALETLVDVAEEEIPPQAKTALYRIVQEALHNVVRHAQAKRVMISIVRNARGAELRVCDDGVGFKPAAYATVEPSGKGLGLASMRERAESSGGRYQLTSGRGGTEIRVLWPRFVREGVHAA